MALTDQKRRYAAARLAGLGKKAAAIEAGCPEKTAAQAASRYEKDPDVIAAIARLNMAEKPAAAPTQKTNAQPMQDMEPGIIPPAEDPLTFMRAVMNDLFTDPKLRLDAAKALAAFTLAKPGEKGKKEEREEAAKKASGGRFSSAPPPPRSQLN